MRPWTRGEQIGCWSMVIGVVTCAVVLSTSAPVRDLLWGDASPPVPGEQVDLTFYKEAFEQQKKLLEEQTQAMEEEILRLREERISARKERISSIALRYEEGDERKYDKILFENRCRIPIHVAIHYKDLDATWVTRGWWKVEPYNTVTSDARTRNTPIYLYAENRQAGRTWDGTGREGAVSFTVSDARFDHLKGERFVYEEPREVSFYRRETGKDWVEHKETFECHLEAPP